MVDDSRFWTGITPGDAGPYSAGEMAEVMLYAGAFGGSGSVGDNNSVLLGSGDATFGPLLVMQDSPTSNFVRLSIGRALVMGRFYSNEAIAKYQVAANSSGQPRIDTLILRVDYINQTIRPIIKQGTPAASPVRPTLTKSAGVLWEVPLADIAVANAFASISDANITNYPLYGNLMSNLAHDLILNTQGSDLISPDVVVWDAAAKTAKKTTTANDPRVAGVWAGLNANNTYGRILYAGIMSVRVDSAVAVGDQLVTSTTAGAAKKAGSGQKNVFAVALEASAGAGIIQCVVLPMIYPTNFHSGVAATKSGSLGLSGGFQDLTFDAEAYDTDNYFTVGSASFTFPISGRYQLSAYVNVTGSNGSTSVQLQINGNVLQTYRTGGDCVPLSRVVNVSAGDILKLRVSNGGSSAGSATNCELELELLTG